MLYVLGGKYKGDWKKIAKKLNHKKITPHFLKIRYKELIGTPLQKRTKFVKKEDLMIVKYFESYGLDWTRMATHFSDRSPVMLKNRYYSFIRKKELYDKMLEEVREYEKEGKLVDDIKCDDEDEYNEGCSESELEECDVSSVHIGRSVL